jgi:hypothetical protein
MPDSLVPPEVLDKAARIILERGGIDWDVASSWAKGQARKVANDVAPMIFEAGQAAERERWRKNLIENLDLSARVIDRDKVSVDDAMNAFHDWVDDLSTVTDQGEGETDESAS